MFKFNLGGPLFLVISGLSKVRVTSRANLGMPLFNFRCKYFANSWRFGAGRVSRKSNISVEFLKNMRLISKFGRNSFDEASNYSHSKDDHRMGG